MPVSLCVFAGMNNYKLRKHLHWQLDPASDKPHVYRNQGNQVNPLSFDYDIEYFHVDNIWFDHSVFAFAPQCGGG